MQSGSQLPNGNMNGMNGMNGMSNLHLQNSLQYSLLKYIQTDDPILNTLISFVIISLVTTLVTKIEKLPGLVISCVQYIWKIIYELGRKFFWHRVAKKICKTVYIERITDERQLNPLYNAVAWFLMNQVDLDEEEDIKFMIDDKINEHTKKLPVLLKRVIQDNKRKMEFEGRDVNYMLSNSQIKIDGEDNTRRNDSIKIWIETDKANDNFLEHFTNVCMEKYQTYIKNKINYKSIYQNMNGQWSKICNQPEKMADTIVLRGNDKTELMSEVEHFINNKQWYIDHGFPYSLGIMFYGPPGTGKTSLIKYISNLAGRNTHYLRLPQIKSEEEFNKLLKEVNLEETVMVMEDIDCAGKIVHSRELKDKKDEDKENSDEKPSGQDGKITIVMDRSRDSRDYPNQVSNKDKVTLDVLLNILDGILTTPGQIVIMTTNHKEMLDNALIRPGRIDVNLELGYCDQEMISKLFKNFYGIDDDELIKYNYEISKIEQNKYSPAYVMNVFRKHKYNPKLGIQGISK